MVACIISEKRELRQSEIISNLVQYKYDAVAKEAIEVVQLYSILLSQDCDLLRDYDDRAENKLSSLNGVLLFEADFIANIRLRLPGGDILRRIERHGEERYHLLSAVHADSDCLGEGIEKLIIDFRRFYTMDAGEVYRQFKPESQEGAKRRCRLASPYREHLQSRAAYYLQRVALPCDIP